MTGTDSQTVFWDRKTRGAPRQAGVPSENGHFHANDRLLIADILYGNPIAAEGFVTRYARLIYRVLHSTGLSGEETEDLFQQVFVHLWEDDHRRLRLWQGRGKGKFSTYLGVLVIRLVSDHKRRIAHDYVASVLERADRQHTWEDVRDALRPGIPGGTPDPVQQICARQQSAMIKDALGNLRGRDARLITLRHIEEQSYQEISVAMGMTINHVRVALFRAEGRLRRLLVERHPELFDQ